MPNNPDQDRGNPGSPKRPRLAILRGHSLYFLISVLSTVAFLFQFSPFLSQVQLSEGKAAIDIPDAQEVVFYGETSSCEVSGTGGGVREKPWPIEVPRGSWYNPWVTVYNPHGSEKSNGAAPTAGAEITCRDTAARVWITGLDSFPLFTQNTPVRLRLLWAGGAFFIACIFFPHALRSIRHTMTGQKQKGPTTDTD